MPVTDPGGVVPSGVQHEIYSGDQVAVATEVGATLRSYTVGGWGVLDGFGIDEMCSGGRGQVLAPWPNRLRDGNFVFEGVACQAPIDEIGAANAIHGLVRWSRWTLASRAQNRVRLEQIVYPQPAYRWCLALSLTYSLSWEGLSVEVEATNRSGSPAPFGVGFHPYLSCGAASIDTAVLTIPARYTLTTDERQIPIGTSPVEGTLMDFRSGAPIGGEVGPVHLDTCFTDLERGPDGLAAVSITDAGTGRGVEVWADGRFSCFMVYTGDTLAEVDRRRRGVAVEPMTCWPNALQSGRGIVRLDPGGVFRARWGIRPRAPRSEE